MTEAYDKETHELLLQAYNRDELRELALALGIDDEDLSGTNRAAVARELVLYMTRRGELERLKEQIRRDRPNLFAGAAFTAPLQFPPAATHFTGRGFELEQLLAALQPGRIVTLFGPGGIGKTALAVEALRALFPFPLEVVQGEDPARFPGGVLFHTFYGRPAAADAASEIAQVCGHNPNPDPLAAFAAACRGRQALLVFDGSEEADDLQALLERRGHCGALITSRRRADVKETGIEVERLPPEDALALLRALAGERAAEETAAREVCELVGNLPLALRLAGALMFREGQSAAEYASWLRESGLAALEFGARRQESVPILMGNSMAQVGEAARATLGVAGCLALQPFDLAPVAVALELKEREAQRALGELVNYELLRRTGEGYLVTHALVHAYARERLAVGEQEIGRLGGYYATLAETESAKGLPGYARLNTERAHILAVLARLAEAGEWATANDLVWAVEDWLDIQGYPRDRIAALEVGVAAARALQRPHDEGSHVMHLGHALRVTGDAQAALMRYEEALAISRRTDNKQTEGNALGSLGLAYAALGQVQRAIEFYEAALSIAREIGDRRGEGDSLGNLGLAYRALGQVARAIEFHEAALAIAREIGDRRGEGSRLGNLGNAYRNLGQVERAIEFYEAALSIAREIGDRRGEGNRLYSLGLALEQLAQKEEAISYFEQALAIYEAIKAPKEARAREQLARLRGAVS